LKCEDWGIRFGFIEGRADLFTAEETLWVQYFGAARLGEVGI